MDLTLALTHRCNLACSYCYAGEKGPVSMTDDVAEQSLEFAFSFDSQKMQLGFFGGEPLMEWDLLKRGTVLAERMADEKGVSLKKTVTTNATLLSEDKAEWLRDHEFYLGVSIDGNRAMHNITRPFTGGGSSFDACIAGLDNVLPLIPDLEVIVVPDPSNVDHMAESVRFLIEEKQVNRVGINPNFYCDWSDDECSAKNRGFE